VRDVGVGLVAEELHQPVVPVQRVRPQVPVEAADVGGGEAQVEAHGAGFELGGERAALELALPARSHLALDARGLPTGASEAEAAERAPLGDRRFDDHYAVGSDPVAFTVQDAERAMTVRFERGYPFAQVFAPPGESFVCFEPMTAAVNALAHPGACEVVEAYDAAFAVHVASTMGA